VLASVDADEDFGDDFRGCVMNISLGKTKYWAPVCDIAIKPFIGQKFRSLDDVVEFYALEKASKSTRECKPCHQCVHHDSCNCPLKA